MNKIMSIYDEAVRRFGKEQVGGLCNSHGAWDSSLGTVPQNRHSDLGAALTRMMGSARAVAQARADFKTIDEVNERAKREAKPNTPNVIDNQFVADVYAKWNTKTPEGE